MTKQIGAGKYWSALNKSKKKYARLLLRIIETVPKALEKSRGKLISDMGKRREKEYLLPLTEIYRDGLNCSKVALMS